MEINIECMGLIELDLLNDRIAKSMLDNKEKAELFDRVKEREKFLKSNFMCEDSELSMFELEDVL